MKNSNAFLTLLMASASVVSSSPTGCGIHCSPDGGAQLAPRLFFSDPKARPTSSGFGFPSLFFPPKECPTCPACPATNPAPPVCSQPPAAQPPAGQPPAGQPPTAAAPKDCPQPKACSPLSFIPSLKDLFQPKPPSTTGGNGFPLGFPLPTGGFPLLPLPTGGFPLLPFPPKTTTTTETTTITVTSQAPTVTLSVVTVTSADTTITSTVTETGPKETITQVTTTTVYPQPPPPPPTPSSKPFQLPCSGCDNTKMFSPDFLKCCLASVSSGGGNRGPI